MWIFFRYISELISLIIHIEKNGISDKSFQVIFLKQMDIHNQEVIFCEYDGEYRIYCGICDKFCIECFLKTILNHKLILILFVRETK